MPPIIAVVAMAGMMTMMMIIHLIGGIKRRIHIHLVTMKMIIALVGMMMGIRGLPHWGIWGYCNMCWALGAIDYNQNAPILSH